MLRDFIESNYITICNIQKSLHFDQKMKEMARKNQFDSLFVKDWMRNYGLFQGISGDDRELIVQVYIENICDVVDGRNPTEPSDLKDMFNELHSLFYAAVPRKWLSAVSKLLWCSFPDDIVIYDSFVERALVVLQPLLPELHNYPRIGESTKPKNKNDIPLITSFYIRYCAMVYEIFVLHEKQLHQLREVHSEQYPHDIRIIDKALWILGSPNQDFDIKDV
ncbi:hypothetical protein [Vibrio parahaemolyticus]|uniref:hypothetical protein n=1 Tax=Vibrio parahaemolyticus TaxID=670 RepID=UPI00047272E9|nr:hypothetical protein [Vibrio parahaemolyticus]MDG2844623.1 hypothetical protein [Vibrio parahaemolyticus]MDG2865531.1 hypothetical protein [Vibrio parahaemolyticus]RXQ00866.1 hypothetical protein EGL69_21995 [Vibrio parahaemolyticus]